MHRQSRSELAVSWQLPLASQKSALQVVRERPAAAELDSEALLPLIEQELDSLTHALARPSTRQTSGLASVSSRAQESFAGASGDAPLRLHRWGPLAFSCSRLPSSSVMDSDLLVSGLPFMEVEDCPVCAWLPAMHVCVCGCQSNVICSARHFCE